MEQARRDRIVALALEKQAGVADMAVRAGKFLVEHAGGAVRKARDWFLARNVGAADVPKGYQPFRKATSATKVRTQGPTLRMPHVEEGLSAKLHPKRVQGFTPKVRAPEQLRVGAYRRRVRNMRIGGTALGAAGLGVGIPLVARD